MPPDMNDEAFLDVLIHQGVLHCDQESDRFYCPIPSFRAYLVERGRAGLGHDRGPPDDDDFSLS